MWGDQMPRKNEETSESERFSLTLQPKQSKRLNEYCLAVANKKGKMPHAIKTKIMRMALDEWLEKHDSDYDIKL
jgi:hypothetical protein